MRGNPPKVRILHLPPVGESSNGRTQRFGRCYVGSIPTSPAMLIFLHNYRIRPAKALKRVGYMHRVAEDDFILLDAHIGRFHAKIIDTQVINLHYDIFVDGSHWAPRLPIKVGGEKKRILKYIRPAQFRNIKDREFRSLLKRYLLMV